MATSVRYLLLSVFVMAVVVVPSTAAQSFRPKALVIPVLKDSKTLQYVTHINQRTPLVPLKLVVDLGGQFLWTDCESGYVSSTYRPARCGSAICSLANSDGCGNCFSPPGPGCNNNTCGVLPDNSVTHTATSGEVATDVVSVNSTDGSNPGRPVTVSRFVFACAPQFLLKGLASGATGMAGLGRTRIGLPSQLASAFSFNRKFALCLSASSTFEATIFFGPGPYTFLPGIDVSQSLAYTRLYVNPVSTASAFSSGEPSAEYFIKVNSINITDTVLPLNKSLLNIDSGGYGGTKISTVNPYTVLESSIHKLLSDEFTRQAAARNITRVAAVAPFDTCFSTQNVLGTSVGASVPWIYLNLEGNVSWTITGSNSMVQVSDNVLCLGFVNGGSSPRTSIVIGGFQLEDNLVQFDLATSRLGFSSTLLGRQTTCANFNFTASVS
ncbi:hypothetical protein MLD38_012315 [Melastoma candidum]|uniref:Uncharacterized protein n=1 Tax=Melastoma candidum TaxID=119954 RepID=A0ACB9R5Z4_9MYRT|nr:hypothetical protein MLD38_012315 [Melastoma candidum]